MSTQSRGATPPVSVNGVIYLRASDGGDGGGHVSRYRPVVARLKPVGSATIVYGASVSAAIRPRRSERHDRVAGGDT